MSILIEARDAYRRSASDLPPWGRIAPGERLWVLFEWQIIATAVVDHVREIGECSVNELRALTVGYQLHDLEDYWRDLSGEGLLGRLSAVVIWTRDERRREQPFKRLAGLSSGDPMAFLGSTWIVVDSPELRAKWLLAGSTDEPVEVDIPSEVGGERTGQIERQGRSFTVVVGYIGCLLLVLLVLVFLVPPFLGWLFSVSR